MKYETMIKILFVMLAKKKVTANYLAKRFDISVRTVLRYLTAMSLANIPIVSEHGRNGGYYISETYKLPAGFLTENEFNAVIGVLTSYNSEVGNADVASAADKLAASKQGEQINISAGNFIIDGSAWDGNDSFTANVALMEKAIEKRLLVKIKYVDKLGKESARSIEPYYIVLKQGLWYVYAYCTLRKEFRMFKISRISFAELTSDPFVRRETDFGKDDLKEWFGELPREEVDLEVDERARADVEEWLGVGALQSGSDGKFYVSARLPYDGWLVSKILSFGKSVKVIGPGKLKDDVKSAAAAIAEIYS